MLQCVTIPLPLATLATVLAFLLPAFAGAEENPDAKPRWPAPFGGEWHAFITFESDYAQNGISNTQLGPALQAGIDWRSPNLLPAGQPPMWIYAYVFGSNVSFPNAGNGIELDFSGGLKLKLMERKLGLAAGYIRYTYPDLSAAYALEYGEFEFKVDYDFGPVWANGRVRYSPATFSNAGQTWNKRALASVPLSFMPKLPFDAQLSLYGAIGNYWFQKPEQVGLPRNDYWYWTVGLVTSVLGLDITVAYTDTSIDIPDCNYTRFCSARAFVSVSKVF